MKRALHYATPARVPVAACLWSRRISQSPRGAVAIRSLSASSSSKGGPPKGPQFGKQVAGDDAAAAQGLHDIGRGRFQYLGDFVASMNKGPVKLDFSKETKPLSQKDIERDQLNERNLKMIQRSLMLGSALAVAGCVIGWQVTKWYYGVKDMKEFGAVMKERMPKVSGSLEDSMIGRKLKETSEQSRESISENAELTDWRRSLRDKFNTEEGAALARKNSQILADKRKAEKAMRKSTKHPQGSTTAVKASTAEDADAESAAVLAAVAAAVEAEQASELKEVASNADAADTLPERKLARRMTQVVETVADQAAPLVRSLSKTLTSAVAASTTEAKPPAPPDTPAAEVAAPSITEQAASITRSISRTLSSLAGSTKATKSIADTPETTPTEPNK